MWQSAQYLRRKERRKWQLQLFTANWQKQNISNWWKIMGKFTQYFKADTDKLQWLPPRAWGLMLFLRWPLMVHRLGMHSLVFNFLVRYKPQKTRVITLYVHLLKGFSSKTTKRLWLHSLRKCFQACWLDQQWMEAPSPKESHDSWVLNRPPSSLRVSREWNRKLGGNL